MAKEITCFYIQKLYHFLGRPPESLTYLFLKHIRVDDNNAQIKHN